MDFELKLFELRMGVEVARESGVAGAEVGNCTRRGFAAGKGRLTLWLNRSQGCAVEDSRDEDVDWVGGPRGLDLLRKAGMVLGEERWGGGEEREGCGGERCIESLIEVPEPCRGEFVAHLQLERGQVGRSIWRRLSGEEGRGRFGSVVVLVLVVASLPLRLLVLRRLSCVRRLAVIATEWAVLRIVLL